jgi:enoyl-CoA hydratase/carnithine racemase
MQPQLDRNVISTRGSFEAYFDRYPSVRMSRDEHGILQVVLHSNGDSLRWSFDLIEQFARAFRDVASDRKNRVVVLTGAGREYVGPRANVPEGQIANMTQKAMGSSPDPKFFVTGCANARDMQNALLDIAVPVVCAVNGPVLRHCELALWADVVLASEDASFEDSAHFDLQGLVPGDGMHIIATMLMGINRARYFLLTGEVIDAREALRLGLVGEVHPKERVLARAHELARKFAQKSDFALRHTRALLTHPIKKQVLELASLGLMMESMAKLAD